MTTAKPIKRKKELYPISHDHHQGLVFCNRLNKAHLADATTLKRFIDDFYEKHLRPHCKKEEEILLPLLSDLKIASRLLEDHLRHKNLIDALALKNAEVHHLASLLSASLNDHIRFEEQELLPHIEENCTPSQLAAIETALGIAETIGHHFEPQFWKNHEN
jgi:hemerythrin-like domain-containing protein